MKISNTPCPGGHQTDSRGQCPHFECHSFNGDCQNGGLCNDGICNCPSGFLGRDCTLILGNIENQSMLKIDDRSRF